MADDDACEQAIRQFAEITDSDEAFAHFMLQDDGFDLERTLTRYYSAEDPDALYAQFRAENAEGSDMAEEEVESGSSREPQPPTKKRKPSSADAAAHYFPAELTLVSWNVDGLDERARDKRFNAVLYVIAKANPEVIFLQEVVVEMLPPLSQLMGQMYTMVISDTDAPYFCVTLVSKDIQIQRSEVFPFANSGMWRSMTLVEAKWQRLQLRLINTHLESMRESGAIRKAQFRECMDKMMAPLAASNPAETLTIFAGDMNIRDKEISELGGLPVGVRDAWESAGGAPATRFTWDMCRNDNHTGNGRARCRFDRVYFSGPYADVDFKLEGTSRVKGPDLFASDHFALVCRFINPNNEGDNVDEAKSTAASSSAGSSTSN